MPSARRDPSRLFLPPAVQLERRSGGVTLLRSPVPLEPCPPSIGADLERWARIAPDRPFLQERGPDGAWRGPTWGAGLDLVRRIATGLLERDLGPDRPVVILSDNAVEHGLLTLAAMHVGIPVAPVSPAYSTMSADFAKLRAIVALARPGLIYVADPERYAPALRALRAGSDVEVVAGTGSVESGVTPFAALTGRRDDAAVDARFGAVGPDTVAKLLFTSGSTGDPKGVINTQRMLSVNQQARTQVWPFLLEEPPVIVDWLPWSHTFGGNHNFNLVVRHGGTLYIDGGRPVPALFGQTVANLREIAPTIYFNVPRGYDMLVTALRGDSELRRNFFSRIRIVFYAAAALPQHLWEALDELARATVGEPVVLTSAWGSTETAPLAADCHFQADRSGVIGLPVPGTELKLVPNGTKQEVRVRGPNVTPGYWRRPDLTASHFDEEGFYRIGDAVRLADPDDPARGLLFDGRVSEDFKLDSGTWVNVGTLRVAAIAALAPVAQDVVVAGHDRSEIGFLVFPNLPACRELCGAIGKDAPVSAVLAEPAVRRAVGAGLAALRRTGQGTSSYGTRAILLAEPASIDAGEITDKGYLNQRAVLTHRAALVEALYQADDHPGVIRIAVDET
jgi:feruloyl-CoA synthase